MPGDVLSVSWDNSLAVFVPRCNTVVRCEVLWDLVRSCATDDALFTRLPPCSRRQLGRCLTLPLIAKFDNGQKDAYIQLVTWRVLILISVANEVIYLFCVSSNHRWIWFFPFMVRCVGLRIKLTSHLFKWIALVLKYHKEEFSHVL